MLDALRNTPRQALLLAGLFVTAGYVILTFYDYFALRTIGLRHVPYRIALALAGFQQLRHRPATLASAPFPVAPCATAFIRRPWGPQSARGCEDLSIMALTPSPKG